MNAERTGEQAMQEEQDKAAEMRREFQLKKAQAQVDLCLEHLRVVVDIWGSDIDIITKSIRLGMQDAMTRQRLLQIQAEVPPSYHSGGVVDEWNKGGKGPVIGVPYRVAEQLVQEYSKAPTHHDSARCPYCGNWFKLSAARDGDHVYDDGVHSLYCPVCTRDFEVTTHTTLCFESPMMVKS